MTAPSDAPPACWGDRCGATASTLCAAHCLLVAVLPAMLTSAGLALLLSEAFEWALVATAATLGVVALVFGLRRHRDIWIASAMAVGILATLGSRLLEGGSLGQLPSVAASVVLVGAHVWNMRRARVALRGARA